MKKYLLIQNDGLIHEGDLMLIGSSTKRNDSTKIGMFGSGWKYALAYILRNKLDIKIFSGKDEISVGTKMLMHRDKMVEVITIQDKETSLTTQMGPKWTAWMSLREIISNAYDEGGFIMTTVINPTELTSTDNCTNIWLELNKSLDSCIRNYSDYFAFDREPDAVNSIGKIYLHEKYDKNESFSYPIIYRKGIRAYDEYTYNIGFDIDFKDIEINESRLISNSSDIFHGIRDYMENGSVPKEMLKRILLSDYSIHFTCVSINESLVLLIKQLIKDGYTIVNKKIDNFSGLLGITGKKLLVRDNWYSHLESLEIVKNPLHSDGEVDFMENFNHKIDLDSVQDFLSLFNFNDITLKVGYLKGFYSNVVPTNTGSFLIDNDRCKNLMPKEIAAEIIGSMTNKFALNIIENKIKS